MTTSSLMVPVMDGIAVGHAAALGRAAAAAGWDVDNPQITAVMASAPADLQPRLVAAFEAAYSAAAPERTAA